MSAASLPEAFAAVVARDGVRPALTAGGTTWTYRQLGARVDQITAALRGMGVGLETPVAVFLERSPDLVAGLLGILRAGGCYVPVDPHYPAGRVEFMLEDSGAPVLLTTRELAARLPGYRGRRLHVEELGEGTTLEAAGPDPGDREWPAVTGDHLAYLLYTSGSTGRPKGCGVTHRNVLRLFSATEPWFGFHRDDVWTLFHSAAFDFSVWEMWGALLHGGRLVVVPYRVSRSPAEFHRLLVQEQVTVLNQTPSAFRQLMAAEAGSPDSARLALRYVIFGGEALEMRSLQPWFDRHGDRRPRLVNMYGITETTVHVTYRPLSAADVAGGSVIGVPIPDLDLHVLDERMQECPVGEAGEIYVGGAGVARGYWNRPELTAARFVESPFRPGGRLYRSGDLARRLPGGDLEYLGRIDQQVKIRGFRVELGEIEGALRGHPAVREVVVLPCGEGEAAQLRAFVVVEGPAPTAAELREHLGRTLPDYMIPAGYRRVERVPLTVHGKTDRDALLQMEGPGLEQGGEADGEAPATALERELAAQWRELLGVDSVGRESDFFALGGHSLLAMRVVGRAARLAGEPVPVGLLFEHPTLAGFARAIEARRAERAEGDDFGTEAAPAAPAEDWPLTPLQQGMLFHHLSATTPGVDIGQLEVDLPGEVDPALLRRAWEQVLARQEVLRTRFGWENRPEPRQEFVPGVALPWAEEDWSGLDEAEFHRRFQAFLAEDRRRGFDLAGAPLFRLQLFRRPGGGVWLVWTFHHALLDDRGYEWVIRDVWGAYDAWRRGGEPAWPERGSFRDYLRGLARQPSLASEEFWRERLRGFSRPTPLVVDRPAGEEAPEMLQADEELAWEAGDTTALRDWAASQGVGLDTLVRAAWGCVLSRYSGETDLVFGAIHSARRGAVPGAESMVGCLWNTVPVRWTAGEGVPVAGWLRGLEEAWRATEAHAQVPLPLVQGWSEVRPGRPLFETLVDVEEDHLPDALAAEGGPWTGRTLRFHGQTNFPLVLAAYPGARLHLKLEYDPRRFEAGTLRRLMGHVRTVLQALPRNWAGTVGDLPLLTAEEERTLRSESDSTRVDSPPGRGLHRWFEEQVARTPGAVAVEAGGRRLSYGELNAQANRLAWRLKDEGVGPDRLVGVFLERSLEMVVALLGVLKAGGAYVPIDPEYPAARVAFMLADAAAPVVLSQDGLAPRVAGAVPGTRVLCMEELVRDPGPDPGNPPDPVEPASLAYVLYTSGSTGRPKGVMIPHQAIENHMRWMLAALPLAPDDCVLQKTPFSFDASVWEFFAPLLAGARLAMAPPGAHRDPAALVAALHDHGVTVLQLVPSVLDLLLEHGGLRGCPRLRRVCCGGEALTAGLVRRFQEAHPAELVNLYGPTEVTIDSVAWTVPPAFAGRTVPIGRPVANTRALVLDAALRPVPVGVPGELYLGGPQLARGYLHRPDLTAERFVPDPFSPGSEERLYRTGDLVRRREDGLLEYLGRLDQQVKWHGHRIEPGEIESALLALPGVGRAAVEVRPSRAGEPRLMAWVAPVPGVRVEGAGLAAELRRLLPGWMVPSPIIPVESWPQLPSGKLDRAALPEPEERPADSLPSGEAPQSELEDRIARVWAEVLGRPAVGRHDNFFDLGGQSLRAMRVVAVLAGHGWRVGIPDLLQHPTVAGLAAAIEARGGGGGAARRAADRGPARDAAVPPLERVPRGGTLPLSLEQERLWFLHHALAAPAAYNVPLMFRIRGPLDTDRLDRALRQVAERHEVLRMRIAGQDGQPVAHLAHLPRSVLRVIRCPEATGEERAGAARDWFAREFEQPFDLGQAPLWRATCLEWEPEEHALLLVAHHVICDEWSLRLWMEELSATYEALRRGPAADLPAPAWQYADYAAWQRARQGADLAGPDRDYWRQALENLPGERELPGDFPRPASPTQRGGVVRRTLPPDLIPQLEELGRQEQATLFMVLLAAWQAFLARMGGGDDVVVASPIAQRDHPELVSLLGFFLNTLPLRARVDRQQGFRTHLRAVCQAVLGALQHGRLPFHEIVRDARVGGSADPTPLMQVMLVVNNDLPRELALGPARGTVIDGEWTLCKADLTLFFGQPEEGVWKATLEYSRDQFRLATADRLLAGMVHWLESVVARPEAPVDDLALVPEPERQQLLHEFQGAPAEFASIGDGLHGLCAAQAARTPDRVAVEFGEQTLTFQELDRWAGRLARELADEGVGPGTVVGIGMERGLELVAALLAVLKSGAAYLPLDPSLPPERLAFLLEDAGVRILLTTEASGGPWPSDGLRRWMVQRRTEAGADGRELHRPVDPAAVAYVLYTSGSTGRPKGVRLPHRAIVNHMQWMQARFPVGSDDAVLQKTPIGFDASVWEFFLPLMTGARLVLAPPGTHREPARLVECIQRHRVTVVQFVPALLEWFLDAPGAGDSRSLRRIFCGGEALPTALARRAGGMLGAEVVNLYGPTETAIDASYWVCRPDDPGPFVPIGRPVANTRLYVLDERRRPLPVGVAGELYIAGVQVGLGYLNRDELTTERFLPDPWAPEPGARMYRTGDRCRWRSDGVLEFLGRLDGQVKVRGQRVEPGEVEAVLREHPEVSQAVVVVRRDAAGTSVLRACVVPRGAAALEGEALRAHASRRLAAGMVPGEWVVLERLPLLPGGKVDRRRLETLEVFRTGSGRDPVPPEGRLEQSLAKIWESLLERGPVGRSDRFFDLGGHSLLAMRLVARVRQELGVELSVASVLAAPTLAELAAVIGSHAPRAATAPAPAIRRVPRQGPVRSPAPEGPRPASAG